MKPERNLRGKARETEGYEGASPIRMAGMQKDPQLPSFSTKLRNDEKRSDSTAARSVHSQQYSVFGEDQSARQNIQNGNPVVQSPERKNPGKKSFSASFWENQTAVPKAANSQRTAPRAVLRNAENNGYRSARAKRHRRLKVLPCLILLLIVLTVIFLAIWLVRSLGNDAPETAVAAEGTMAVYNEDFWREKVYVGEDVLNGSGEKVMVPRSEYDALVKGIGGKENLEKHAYLLKVAKGTLQPNYIKRGSVFSAPTGKKYIALSFDDGPSASTIDEYLKILKEHNATATFYMLGANMKNDPDSVQKIVESGNELATHTWNHKNLNRTSAEIIRDDLEKSSSSFKEMVGYRPYLMRCPYGNINDTVKSLNQEYGMISCMWDIDTLDWKVSDPNTIINNVKAHAGDGQIILMHEGKKVDLKVLPEILSWLNEEGYQVVSVGELLWQAHLNGMDGLSENTTTEPQSDASTETEPQEAQ